MAHPRTSVIVIVIMSVVTCNAAQSSQQPTAEEKEIMDGLKAPTLEERHRAANRLRDVRRPSEAAILALIKAAREELTNVIEIDRRRKPSKEDLKRLPPMQGLTTLIEIESEPNEFIGTRFKLMGGISIDDYYNYGYDDAEDTHYSLEFQQANENAEFIPGARTFVYLQRDFGEALVRKLQRLEQRNKAGAVVLECTIYRSRYEEAGTNAYIEVLDWQELSPSRDSWEPLALGRSVVYFNVLETCGRSAVQPIVDEIEWLVLLEGRGTVDTVILVMLKDALTEMDIRDRLYAVRQLERAKQRNRRKKLEVVVQFDNLVNLVRPDPSERRRR